LPGEGIQRKGKREGNDFRLKNLEKGCGAKKSFSLIGVAHNKRRGRKYIRTRMA